MTQVSGVSMGKAIKYGKPFLELIRNYVEEYEIERPQEFVIRTVANKSKAKVAIIHGIDNQMDLEDIAANNRLDMAELLEEMEMIVYSGTKLNIDRSEERRVGKESRSWRMR